MRYTFSSQALTVAFRGVRLLSTGRLHGSDAICCRIGLSALVGCIGYVVPPARNEFLQDPNPARGAAWIRNAFSVAIEHMHPARALKASGNC